MPGSSSSATNETTYDLSISYEYFANSPDTLLPDDYSNEWGKSYDNYLITVEHGRYGQTWIEKISSLSNTCPPIKK